MRLILHDLGAPLPYEVSARLKMVILNVFIIVSVMTMVLIQMKHGYMVIGSTRQTMLFLHQS